MHKGQLQGRVGQLKVGDEKDKIMKEMAKRWTTQRGVGQLKVGDERVEGNRYPSVKPGRSPQTRLR